MPRLDLPARPPASRTPAKPPRPLDVRPTRWQLLRRRQRWLLRPVALGLVSLAMLGGLAATVRHAPVGIGTGIGTGVGTGIGTSVGAIATVQDRLGSFLGFAVADVVIEGRDKTPEPMLRAALGVSPGDRLLGFSLDAARARIESLAWVEHATVERRLPGTVVVRLQERRPFAVWQSGGQFKLIDRAGQVVAEQDPAKDAAAFASLPLVVGPGAPEAAAALLDQLAAHPQLRSRVVAAVRVGDRRWNLKLSNGADVLLPEGAAAAAMARLMELHASQALLDRPLQTVDLRAPDRMVVRPAPEPRAPVPAGPRRPT